MSDTAATFSAESGSSTLSGSEPAEAAGAATCLSSGETKLSESLSVMTFLRYLFSAEVLNASCSFLSFALIRSMSGTRNARTAATTATPVMAYMVYWVP